MINELSRRYLQELRVAQEQINSSSLREETHDASDHEVYETLTSEYNIEFGPLKVSVKKSKTVTGKLNTFKKASQSLSKEDVTHSRETFSNEQIEQMRMLRSPEQSLPCGTYKRIDIRI